MIRASRLSLVLASALLIAVSGAARGTTTEPSKPPVKKPAEPGAPRSRTINFNYEAYYEFWGGDRENFDIWVPVPQESAEQKVSDMVIYSPSSDPIEADPEYGNRVIHVHSGPRGGLPVRVKVKFNVTRSEILHRDLAAKPAHPAAPPPNLSRYLKGDKLLPIDAQTKALAATVTKGKTSTVQKARSIYDYVITTMKYDKNGAGWGRGDLKYALKMKSGNCTEFNAVFDALARASSIPARQVMGFKVPRAQGEGTLSEYHCWSEFYLNGTGWVPVDPVEGAANTYRRDYYFGNLDPDRVAYSVGRDVVLKPPQTGPPLNFFLYPYAEGDGEPLTGASYRFSWSEGPSDSFTSPAASEPKP